MRACIPAEEAEFMLDRYEVHMTEVYIIGGTNIVVLDVSADLELYRIGILTWAAGLHRNDQRLKILSSRGADTSDKIRGEYRDATFLADDFAILYVSMPVNLKSSKLPHFMPARLQCQVQFVFLDIEREKKFEIKSDLSCV